MTHLLHAKTLKGIKRSASRKKVRSGSKNLLSTLRNLSLHRALNKFWNWFQEVTEMVKGKP